jgi:competence protein ComEC
MDTGVSQESIRDRLTKLPSRIAKIPMIVVLATLSLGTTVSSLLPDQLSIPMLLTAVAILASLLLICVYRWRKNSSYPKWQERILVTIALLAVFLVGAMRLQVERNRIQSDRLSALAGEFLSPIVLEGTVVSIPRWRPDTLRQRAAPDDTKLLSDDLWQTVFDVRVSAIRDSEAWKNDRFGLIRITAQGRNRSLLPGDHVRCFVEWQRIMPPTNPGQSDYSQRAAAEGVFVRGRTDVPSQIQVIPAKGWNLMNHLRLDRFIGGIVTTADQAFHSYVPFGQARMASALVLGQREQAEWELQESMLATGTIHMLAISGMHIELVAVSILTLGSLMLWKRKTNLTVTIGVVLVYSLVAGANPPVMRAAIFVVLLCFARWIGRPTKSMNVLAFAAVVLLVYNSNNLMDIGTQLSFLAVTVLIFLGSNRASMLADQDSLNDLLLATSHPFVRWFWYLVDLAWNMLKVSAWVWLLTAPLTLYYFNIVSPIACFLNVLLWIPIFISLLAGILLLMTSSIVSWIPLVGPWIGALVGYPLGAICAFGLVIVDRVVKVSEKVPMSHFWIPSPSLWMVIAFYGMLVLMITVLGFGKTPRRWIASLTCLWLVVAGMPLLDRFGVSPYQTKSSQGPQPMLSTFIDVGHGTCVMIELPNGQVWLYDAGRMGDASKSHLQISDVLWERRRTRIDKIFLSHADSDHFSAIARLAKRFQVGEFCTTSQALASTSNGMQELLASLRRQSIPVIALDDQSNLNRLKNENESLTVEILHPGKSGVSGSDNANSMCLLFTCYGKKLLLPGDLEGAGTKRLLERHRTVIDVLMAPHHGSLSTDPAMLLAWCQPSVVAISGGTKARNPKILDAYSAPDRQVLITALNHAVRIAFSINDPIKVETWQHPNWIPCNNE